MNNLSHLYETWFQNYAITDHLNVVCFHFQKSVLTKWWTHELVRWEQRAEVKVLTLKTKIT